MRSRGAGGIEWPTLALLALCYAAWGAAGLWLVPVSLPLAVLATAILLALHASLQHEVLHGHPFADARLNAALVFPALGLFIPYGRFRDTHLAHHRDAILTDPYDDPESNYLDPAQWARLPRWRGALLAANNTLAGRMLIGPALSLAALLRDDLAAIRGGDRRVAAAWLWHLPALAPVALWLWLSPMPGWAYAAAAYLGLSLLKIRTFAEHQAHRQARCRSVVIEDRGPLALLFLNNNFHVVHHMHPRLPWYRLPGRYFADRGRYLRCNGGYVYRSYTALFLRHFLRAKDPVPHPLWRGR